MLSPHGFHSEHATKAPYAAATAVAQRPTGEVDLETAQRAARIEQAVRVRTGGRVRNLRVEIRNDEVFLSGECANFHCKQLAQHAAREFLGPAQLTNQIEVN